MDALPDTHITAIETSTRNPLGPLVRGAFEATLAEQGKLPPAMYSVGGFSGRKIRLFFNNLIAAVPDPRYLEIGIFQGASFCSAIYDNKIKATGIDNWSEYGGPAAVFYTNLAKFRSQGQVVSILERDFRTVDYRALGPFNIMFYDGSHAEKDQYDGVSVPASALDANAIVLVDDWNWDRVRRATFAALRDAGRHIEYSMEVRTSFDGQMPKISGGNSDWHNGLFVGVVSAG
jgi:predicted O-methyltransferase YrrM